MAENFAEFTQGKNIRERARDLIDHKVRGRNLRDIAYSRLDEDNKKAADMIPALLAEPDKGFSTIEEISATERALTFQTFTKVDFVTTGERVVLLKKLKRSAPLIAKLIDATPDPNILNILEAIQPKAAGPGFTEGQSTAERMLIRSVLHDHIPHIAQKLTDSVAEFVKKPKEERQELKNDQPKRSISEFLQKQISEGKVDRDQYGVIAEALAKNIESTHKFPGFMSEAMPYRRSMEIVIMYASEQTKQQMQKDIVDLLADKKQFQSRPVEALSVWLVDYPPKKAREITEFKQKALFKYMDGIGLNGRSFLFNWNYYDKAKRDALKRKSPKLADEIDSVDKSTLLAAKNMERILRLERDRPGAAKYLFEEFGIVFFGRYNWGDLEDQYDAREDAESPWGTFVAAYPDHNDAFYQYSDDLSELSRRLVGKKLRIMETGSKQDLLRRINEKRHKYGPLSYAVISGHGRPNQIELSYVRDLWLTKDDFKRKGAEALRLAFTKNAMIVLNSCSTGVWRGIAQTLSGILQSSVYAPNQSAALEYFELNDSTDEKPFVPVHTKRATVRYEKGRRKLF